MANDIRTRHLIVTLPDVSGEEADTIAADLEIATRIDWANPTSTVTHALGEAVLAGSMAPRVVVKNITNKVTIATVFEHTDRAYLTADEARQLAGALLALAHDIDPTNDQEA